MSYFQIQWMAKHRERNIFHFRTMRVDCEGPSYCAVWCGNLISRRKFLTPTRTPSEREALAKQMFSNDALVSRDEEAHGCFRQIGMHSSQPPSDLLLLRPRANSPSSIIHIPTNLRRGSRTVHVPNNLHSIVHNEVWVVYVRVWSGSGDTVDGRALIQTFQW